MGVIFSIVGLWEGQEKWDCLGLSIYEFVVLVVAYFYYAMRIS
jgi:hypothetical protein